MPAEATRRKTKAATFRMPALSLGQAAILPAEARGRTAQAAAVRMALSLGQAAILPAEAGGRTAKAAPLHLPQPPIG